MLIDTILITVNQDKMNAQMAKTPSKTVANQALHKDNTTSRNTQPGNGKDSVLRQSSHSAIGVRRSSKKATLQPDRRPEIPFSSMRQQQIDRSSILKQPATLNRNQSQNLRRVEQQKKNGAFVNYILNNERRHSLSPDLGNVLSPPERGIHMDVDDAPLSRLRLLI